jgi:hypothetical protein
MRCGGRTVAYRVLVGKQGARDYLQDLGIERRIILKWVFKMWDIKARTGLICLRTGTGARLL